MAADPAPRSPRWSRLRLVLVGFLLAADALVLASLALARPSGWVAPFVVFAIPFAGLVWYFAWAWPRRDLG